MEPDSVVLNYLAEKIVDDIRQGRGLGGVLASALYKYPLIDRLRAIVKPSDRDAILRLASECEDDVAIWSFAVGGLLRTLEYDREVRGLFERSWRKYSSFDRRYHLVFRLLDYADLEPVLQSEIWQFVKANMEKFVFERVDWYGGASNVLGSVRSRLDDASFGSQKKWIYLVSLLASSDREGARVLLEKYAFGSDPFESMVARHVLERFDVPSGDVS